jgi:hypothetical protein
VGRRSLVLLGCVSAVVLLLLGLGGRIGLLSSAQAAASDTTTVTLATTNSSFVDTGVNLPAGATATMTATGDGTCNDSGTSDCPPGDASGTATCADIDFPAGPAGPDINYGAIAGRVGSGAPFAVGDAGTAKGPGELYLVYNDCYYGDNAGSYQVTITVSAPTTTAVTCMLQASTGLYSCNAVVSTLGSGGSAPDGTVDWTVSAGALSARSCTLTGTSGSTAACSVVLTPTQLSNETDQTVTAAYEGNAQFDAGNATATIPAVTVTVTPPATVDTYLDGSADATFNLTLSRASNTPVTVDYETQDGTGTNAAKAAEGDYKPTKGTLTFAPGTTAATIKVQCNADIKLRHTSDFDLDLSGLSGATFPSVASSSALVRNHVPSSAPVGTLKVQAKIKPDLRVGDLGEIRNFEPGREGVVYVERYDTHKIIRLKEGDPIYVGDRIGASPSSASVIKFVLGGAAAVQPGSVVTVQDTRHFTTFPGPNDQGILYKLRQKIKIWDDVSHQKETMTISTNGGVLSGEKG